MIAAVLKEYRKFEIEEREILPPEGDQVQVAVSHASICGTDMHIFNGDFHPRTPVPFIPGHELAGTVVAAGPLAGSFRVGERVAVDPIIWCGECPACQRGHYPACSNLKLIGIDMDGGFCQMVNVPAGMLYRSPENVPMEHLALVEIYGIGFHAVRRAGITPGESIAVWGAGRVGQVILQAARTLTTAPVFMIDVIDERLAIAASHSPDVITLNPLKTDAVAEIMEKTGGRGCDAAFEAVGHPGFPEETLHPVTGAIRSIRGGGRVCVLGLTDEPAAVVFKELIWKEAKIIASRVSHGDYPGVLEKLGSGDLRPELLISGIFPAEKIQEAFEVLENDPARYLKILLDFKPVVSS
jgi:2-desacetyl-2-hydroxyethyl bacteriochlorophyllide A dehydrogenase